MNVPQIENIVRHRLELPHMKTSPVNIQKDGQSFQFTLSMVSIVGILFRDHTHRNCSLNSYVRKVLPCYIPYLGPRSILIMDNAQIHHFEVLELLCISWQPRNWCLDAKINLEYLIILAWLQLNWGSFCGAEGIYEEELCSGRRIWGI